MTRLRLSCRQHPWFTLHLPRYLAVMQADTMASTAMLDEDIVHEVVKLGFKRGDVVTSIQKRSQNKVCRPGEQSTTAQQNCPRQIRNHHLVQNGPHTFLQCALSL